MPATLSIKRNAAYGPQSATLDRVKVGGTYVPATNLRMKVNGVYDAGAGVLPFNITPPVIAGDNFPGSILTCTPGTWGGTPTPLVTHQWQADGIDILGATGLTYVTQFEDGGKAITCLERGTNVVGSIGQPSNAIQMPPPSGFGRGFSNTGFGV